MLHFLFMSHHTLSYTTCRQSCVCVRVIIHIHIHTHTHTHTDTHTNTHILNYTWTRPKFFYLLNSYLAFLCLPAGIGYK